MIAVLCAPGCEVPGSTVAGAIRDEYPAQSVEVVAVDSTWAREAEWDDLLVVVYGTADLPAWAKGYVTAFMAAHPTTDPVTREPRPGGFVVPVATHRSAMQPPAPISLIKAAFYDGTPASLPPIIRAIGALLGLAIRAGEHQIFIAYRSLDGDVLARDLHAKLLAAGFHPWLDEAQDNLPIGVNVQDRIHKQLQCAGMLVVVDTPRAPESEWMGEEILGALGELIPVLPIVTGPQRDISRFNPLSPLQRRVPVKPAGPSDDPLREDEWQRVKNEIEELLLATYRRRLQVIWHSKEAFTRGGFTWSTVDERRRMFEAKREKHARIPSKVVLSHCSVHDIMYIPGLKVVGEYLSKYREIASVNEKLCVYDRDMVLSGAEVAMIWRDLPNVPEFFLVHYNELPALIRSNFTELT